MEKQLIFIDELCAAPSRDSINILLKWVEENEQVLRANSKVVDKVQNPISNKPNWI